MPSLCLISDTHRLHRGLTLPPADVLIHCGDFCSFHRADLEVLADVDAWFAECPATHVLCTGGNHDHELDAGTFRFSHATFLKDRLVEVAGLSFYGAPWVPELRGFAFYATEEELIEKWKLIPAGIDVLITHTPPEGILDLPFNGTRHIGCTHLRQELKRIRPRLHVFGHVHASYGDVTEEGTRYINAAVVAGARFELSHAPVLVELGVG